MKAKSNVTKVAKSVKRFVRHELNKYSTREFCFVIDLAKIREPLQTVEEAAEKAAWFYNNCLIAK